MTSALLTRDEIIRGFVALGADRTAAERAADLELARRTHTGEQATPAALDGVQTSAVITFPLQLLLPWSALVSDDQRHGAIIATVGPTRKPIPKLIMTEAYRAAKGKVMKLARDVVGGAEPVAIPLRLEAFVWLPNTHKHDVPNFAKAVHDALSGIVYVDDVWLHDARWVRAGVDVDRPRAEITITPFRGVA